MTDKSVFTDDEWHALTDKPGERGPANELIGQIVAEATSKQARKELKEHRGRTPQAAIEDVLHELETLFGVTG